KPEMPVERGSETVLIVEDDEDFRKVEAEMLTRLGYRVYAAADGMEGIALFAEKSEEIDLVILDVVMPRMSGRDALEGMRRIRPDIPSLFVTGYSLDGIHVNYILDQDIEALQKPFSFDTLSRKIREVMRNRGRG
ncbi:MAG TPA: response regulator, partial [Syntrophorhabdaceae bacterium]|nr:response regulator [Syntrophorhabdaceae bacterium]